LNKLKENFALLEKEKTITEKNLTDKIERIKEDYERVVEKVNTLEKEKEEIKIPTNKICFNTLYKLFFSKSVRDF
jgi:hypothetical protein